MARGLGGLAEGMLAGADLGLKMRRQEQSEREETNLRQLRGKQEERAESAEERAGETHEQSLKKGELDMSLSQLREGRAKSAEARAVSGEKRAVSQEERSLRAADRADSAEDRAVSASDRSKAEFDWKKTNADRKVREGNVSAMAPIEYERVLQGGDFSPEFIEQSAGTRFDPKFMAKQEYKDAAKHVYEYTGKLVNGDAADLNDTEFLGSLNLLMSPDVKQGIGETDPNTGKTIADKSIVSIDRYKNQGFVFEVETTLDDGSKYVAPITEHRTTNPDDPVNVVPVEKIINQVDGYMRMASAFNQPDLYNAVHRADAKTASESSKETTRRQYLRELGSVDKWEMDQLSKMDTSLMDEKEIKAKTDEVKSRADERRKRTANRYKLPEIEKVGKGDAAIDKPRGGGEARTEVNSWAGDDQKKQAFIAEGQAYAENAGARNPFDAYTPEELDKVYREWANNADADEVAAMM